MLDMDKKRPVSDAGISPPVKLRVPPEGGKGLWSSRRVLFSLEVAPCRQNVMALRRMHLRPGLRNEPSVVDGQYLGMATFQDK